jgi:hypothetical protein
VDITPKNNVIAQDIERVSIGNVLPKLDLKVVSSEN